MGVGVCVCVCVRVCVCVCTILPEVTYFSPDVSFFLIVHTVLHTIRLFFGGKFDVACLSAIKIFIAYLTLFHIRKKVTRTCMHLFVIIFVLLIFHASSAA